MISIMAFIGFCKIKMNSVGFDGLLARPIPTSQGHYEPTSAKEDAGGISIGTKSPETQRKTKTMNVLIQQNPNK